MCDIDPLLLAELEKLHKAPKIPTNPKGFHGLGALLRYAVEMRVWKD